MTDYKTLKQMASAIGVNYSTARGYVERFPAYFPTRDLPNVRWPVYDADAQDVLKLIKDVYDDGGGTHDVLSALEEHYGTIIQHPSLDSDVTVREPITAGITRVTELLKSGQVGIEYAMKSLQFYREIIHAKEAEIEYLRAEVDKLRKGQGGGH